MPDLSTPDPSAQNTGPRLSPDAADAGTEARRSAVSPTWAQHGEGLTTNQGVRVDDTDNSLKAGARGPSLLEDFHLREKIMHFDHERIPERVVHARGAGAHGTFELHESLEEFTCARFLCDTGTPTPVFVRFSTVVGSRGSFDTARDVRGFATKFYTPEGNFDLVGNNIPIFFIQDGIKFPDLVHAAKPEPDREIPQAQTAHDTLWDFVSLSPESTAMMLWTMSDRAIPRSYRMMEGFGVHTFRLVNAAGETTLAKFHWKPVLGIHGLVWEEAQQLGGVDPDFHRRDLWDAIDSGAFPRWELGLQLLPDTPDQAFKGIDLLDPTKIVPEELAPVRRVGTMTLDRNPTNFFAETEQVAFHAGHVVRGIDVTDDPLLHARLFSYLDTQLIRLGGPNFAQLPINRPLAPVNNNQRDGYGQHAIHRGRAPYSPSSLDDDPPRTAAMDAMDADGLVNRDGTTGAGATNGADRAAGGYVHVPRRVDGPKVRQRAQSFTDHYSQATLFWRSMTPVEQDHIVGGFSFELSKVADEVVVARMLGNLAQVDATLTERVAANLGLPAPAGEPAADVAPSPALSMVPPAPGPIAGRTVGVLAGPGVDVDGLEALSAALDAEHAVLHVIAPRAGVVEGDVVADRTVFNARSVEFDAVVVAGGASAATLAADPTTGVFLQEAYRHHKTVAAWGEGVGVLTASGIPTDAAGVVTAGAGGHDFAVDVAATMGWHRHWDRPAMGPSA